MVSDGVVVRRSDLHGRGLFATRLFKRGALIGVMQGRPVTRNSSHVIWVGDEGTLVTNSLRFINHSDDPNCHVRHTLEVVARRKISPGEELTFNYGEGYFDA